jgi:hypothetical protein
LNVHLEDLLGRVLHLFYIRMFTVSIEGFDFKKSKEDFYFFINIAAALLELWVNDKETVSTLAAVLLELRASIVALYASSFNSFYIPAESGLDIEIRSTFDLCDSKALGYP